MTNEANETRVVCTQHWSDRLFTILGGYSVAAFAAGVAIGGELGVLILMQSKSWVEVGGGAVMTILLLVLGATLAFPVTAALAALPSMVVIWYAERRSVRSPVFYGIMGGVAAAAVIGLYSLALSVWTGTGFTSGALAGVATLAGVFCLPGVCGGLVYWAIAGRDAGCDLQPRTSVRSRSSWLPWVLSLRALRLGGI